MNENTLFWRIFARRSTICFFLSMFLLFFCILRVAVIATSDYTAVHNMQNRLKLTIAKQRGTIFDCNMIPITNRQKKIIAAVSPTPIAVTAISSILKGEEKEKTLDKLQQGKPVLCEVPEKINCNGIICTEVYGDFSEQIPAIHMVGYTDSELKGVTGISAAYDDFLYSDSEIYVAYECSGKGDILEGTAPLLVNDTSIESGGVVTTIDINIQNIAENAADFIDVGAIVITEAKNGKIRASVSKPTFDIFELEKYLDAENSPLLNRALSAFNVGSVFKPCVAAAGIESDNGGFCYECTGSCEIIDRFFKCHKRSGHGILNLNSAIAQSCNTFFYNFAFKTGKAAIYKTARTLRFGRPLKIGKNIYTASGSLPETETLDNIAQLANLSIGQGELLLSPISITTLYSAIANNGLYYVPSVIERTIKGGVFEDYNIGNPTRAMKEDTATTLKNYLCTVLSEGTGITAQPKTITAAGKTATAQTGKYENGTEICQGWFCGFFPVENPLYIVTVFSENILTQTVSCGEIFADIADKIADLKNIA